MATKWVCAECGLSCSTEEGHKPPYCVNCKSREGRDGTKFISWEEHKIRELEERIVLLEENNLRRVIREISPK